VFSLQLFLEVIEEVTDNGYEDAVSDREFSCVDASDVYSIGDLLGVVT
jgi:hypothetical protein